MILIIERVRLRCKCGWWILKMDDNNTFHCRYCGRRWLVKIKVEELVADEKTE